MVGPQQSRVNLDPLSFAIPYQPHAVSIYEFGYRLLPRLYVSQCARPVLLNLPRGSARRVSLPTML
jgi:hypothetical protein